MRRISIADAIDLEVQSARDEREPSQAELRQRDRRIAGRIGAERLDEPGLFLRWLEAMRHERPGLPGRDLENAARIVAVALAVLGFLAGVGLAWGWLSYDPSRPVNVIHFTAVVVGLPLLLLIIWALGLILRRLPALAGLGRQITGTLPWLVERLTAKLSGRGADWAASVWRSAHGARPVLFWLASRTTHGAALAFTLGATLALLAAFYLTDPAFGWRSRLMDSRTLHTVTRTVALPWSNLAEGARPTPEEIERTRYASLSERFATQGANAPARQRGTWAIWWPFVLASLIVYGLIPRLLALMLTAWTLRRALRRAFDPLRLAPLRQRLTPAAEFRSSPSDDSDHPTPLADRAVPQPPAPPSTPATRCHVLRWSGTSIDRATLERLVPQQTGAGIATLRDVGQLDPSADAAAIDAVAQNGQADEPILLVVPSWEPPTSEYRDLLTELRTAAGNRRPIRVLLYNQRNGRPAAPETEDWRQWHAAVASGNDSGTSIAALTEDAR